MLSYFLAIYGQQLAESQEEGTDMLEAQLLAAIPQGFNHRLNTGTSLNTVVRQLVAEDEVVVRMMSFEIGYRNGYLGSRDSLIPMPRSLEFCTEMAELARVWEPWVDVTVKWEDTPPREPHHAVTFRKK